MMQQITVVGRLICRLIEGVEKVPGKLHYRRSGCFPEGHVRDVRPLDIQRRQKAYHGGRKPGMGAFKKATATA